MPSKVTLMPFDPELGKKFMAESQGLVIGLPRSLPKQSEETQEEDEFPDGLTAQEQQDLANRKARREMGR
jgi:hypothetical protein